MPKEVCEETLVSSKRGQSDEKMRNSPQEIQTVHSIHERIGNLTGTFTILDFESVPNDVPNGESEACGKPIRHPARRSAFFEVFLNIWEIVEERREGAEGEGSCAIDGSCVSVDENSIAVLERLRDWMLVDGPTVEEAGEKEDDDRHDPSKREILLTKCVIDRSDDWNEGEVDDVARQIPNPRDAREFFVVVRVPVCRLRPEVILASNVLVLLRENSGEGTLNG